MTDLVPPRRFRLIGELRGEEGTDFGELPRELSTALNRGSDRAVEILSVDVPRPGLIRVEMLLDAGSWKAASDLGQSTMARALEDIGVQLDALHSEHDRRLERAGTQLLPA